MAATTTVRYVSWKLTWNYFINLYMMKFSYFFAKYIFFFYLYIMDKNINVPAKHWRGIGQFSGRHPPHALKSVRLCCPYVNEENKLVYIKTPHIKYLMMNVLGLVENIKNRRPLLFPKNSMFVYQWKLVMQWGEKIKENKRKQKKTKEKIEIWCIRTLNVW